MRPHVVSVLGLWILSFTAVNSQSQSGRALFPPCSLVNRRVIDRIRDQAYQRGYVNAFQSTTESAKAYYIEVLCPEINNNEICGSKDRAKAEEEAREQAKADRKTAIENASEQQLQSWKAELLRCLPIKISDDCRDQGCFFVNDLNACVPLDIAT